MAMETRPITDYAGRIMFRCGVCGAPITHGDLFDLGMRPPDHGESADDYQEAELIDSIEHPALRPRRSQRLVPPARRCS